MLLGRRLHEWREYISRKLDDGGGWTGLSKADQGRAKSPPRHVPEPLSHANGSMVLRFNISIQCASGRELRSGMFRELSAPAAAPDLRIDDEGVSVAGRPSPSIHFELMPSDRIDATNRGAVFQDEVPLIRQRSAVFRPVEGLIPKACSAPRGAVDKVGRRKRELIGGLEDQRRRSHARTRYKSRCLMQRRAGPPS